MEKVQRRFTRVIECFSYEENRHVRVIYIRVGRAKRGYDECKQNYELHAEVDTRSHFYAVGMSKMSRH